MNWALIQNGSSCTLALEAIFFISLIISSPFSLFTFWNAYYVKVRFLDWYFHFFFLLFSVALGCCVLFLFSIVNIHNVKFLILSIFKCTVQSVKSFIGNLMQQSQNSFHFAKLKLCTHCLFVFVLFFLRYFLVIIFNHFKFQVFLFLIPKTFFSQLPFPYYFMLLFFTDLGLNCSMWYVVPWLGNEPGPWTREWNWESPNLWGSSYPCFIWQEYLLSFRGYCILWTGISSL